MDFLLEEDPFEELIRSEHQLEVSFEALERLMSSHTALEDWQARRRQTTDESFEGSIHPLLTAIAGESGVMWSDSELSTESVKTVAASVVRAVINAIAQFFKSLIDFLSNVDLAATWLSRKLNKLERQAATTRGMRPSEATVKIGRLGRFMRVQGDVIDDAVKLEYQLTQLLNVVKVVATDYRNAIISAGNELPNVIRGKTGKVLTEAVVALVERIPFDQLAIKCHMHSAPYDRFKRDHVQATQSLLGGYSLFYLKGKLKEQGPSAFRFHGFVFERTGRNELKVEREYDLATLQPGQIGELPKLVREMLNQVTRSSNSNVRTAANRTRASLDAFLRTGQFEASDMDTVRKAVSAISHWLQQPSRSLLVHSMSVSRAAILYCQQSIKTYK